MNRVLLTGRLTRDPEMRSLPSGKTVTNFSVATNEYRGGEERTEYHSVVTWERCLVAYNQSTYDLGRPRWWV